MKKIITWIFILSCIVALLFLCLPLVLRFDCVYSLISVFLSTFRNAEYKGLYVETLGALFGAFLGVIGAVWAQNLANEQSKSAEIEKHAQIIFADLTDSLACVSKITTADDFPESEAALRQEIVHRDGYDFQSFENLVKDNRIIMLPDWEQMVLSIEQTLSSEELRSLLVLCAKLSELSSIVNANHADNKWQLDAYTILTSISEKTSSLQLILEKLGKNTRKTINRKDKKNESGSVIS